MIKREKNRKLRGSVLLTVVCVMSLLIVFLFGTLALATAANNRAHVNYSTAQTGVTSRTVVDAAIKAMEANSTFGNAVSAIKKDDASSEFEVNVQLGSTVPNAGRYGDISPVSIEYAGQKKFYDSDKNEWVDGDIIRFTSTVSMAGNDSTTSAYIVKQPPAEGDKGSGGGAGFVTTAGADLSCQTNLYGGSYISLPRLGENNNGTEGYQEGTSDVAGAMFYNYDYRTVIDTSGNVSDAKYNDWTTDKTIYRQFAPYNSSDKNKTAFVLYNSDAFAETDLYVNNNMYIENWSGFIFSGKGKGITVWGDMDCSTNAGDHLKYVFKNIDSTDIKFNEIPYIYIDGTITGSAIPLGNASEIETEHYPLNIFCGNMIADGVASDKFKIDGDLYLMNEKKTSIIKPSSPRKLYSWVGSVINKAVSSDPKDKKASSIFSKGNLILGNMIIDGDVRVEGDCTISANTTIKGDLVVGGKLTIENGAKLKFTGEESKLYCDASKATGLDAGITTDPKYKEVNTIEHSNPADHPDAEKVENKHRYYLEYPAKKIDTPWGGTEWKGLFDEWASNGVIFYYKWKDDFNPDDCEGHAFVNYTDINEWNANGIDIKNWLVKEANPYGKYPWGDTRPRNIDNNVDYYYVETVWDDVQGEYVTKSVPTNEREYYVDKNTHERINAYRTVPAFDGSDTGNMMSTLSGLGYDEGSTSVWYEIKTETIVSQDVAAPKSFPISDLATYGDIYPEYAERNVILGIDTISGISKEETQIVKKMDEVLNTVANPYSHEVMPEDFKKVIDDSSSKRFTDTLQIIEYNNKVAVDIDVNTGKYEEATYTGKAIHGGPSWQKKDGTTGDASNLGDTRAAIITESCILNLSTSDTGGKSIIIDPAGQEIYIVIEKLSIASSGNIIINDSNPGSVVNFYIYNNTPDIQATDGSASGVMKLDKTRLATTSYLSEMAKYNNQTMSYGSSDGDLKLETLGKPRVNIYGGKGSLLSSSNTRLLTANIISPNLKVQFSGTEGAYSFSNIYYNDIDIKKPDGSTSNDICQYVIGCLNAKDVTIPNQLSVIYVTDSSSGGGGGAGSGENAFNYRILYYDEY